MNEQQQQIVLLLHQLTSGKSLDNFQQETLMTWARESPHHTVLLEKIQNEEDLTHAIFQRLGENKELAWQNLADRLSLQSRNVALKNESTKIVHRVHFLKTAWFRYAAAIIVILGAATYLWFGNTTSIPANPKNPIKAGSDITAGSNKAILTLANGSTIELENKDNGKTLQQLAGADLAAGVAVLGKNSATSKMQSSAQPTRANEATVFNTITTPRGGQYQIILPDGSKVWLNAASSIKFPTGFTGNERKVEMTGEAYMEIAGNPNQSFIVKANGTEIQVLGTSFNVNAYIDETTIKTTLLSGSVKVKATTAVLLKPGQQAIVIPSGPKQKISVQAVDIEQAIAWKNGSFQFKQTNLGEAMRQLSRWYDVEVIYKNGIPDIKLGGEMKRDLTLSQVLDGLGELGVKFRIEGKRLIVL